MSEGLTVVLIMAAFVIIFPLFWMAIILIVARVGGWYEPGASICRAGASLWRTL